MNSFFMQKAQQLASTIPPDKDHLGAGTVASVVITGIAVVFIGLILLIIFVSVYGKIFEALNKRADAKAKAKAEAAEREKAELEAKQAPARIEEKAPEPVIEDGIEEETVAVIMAAIAAMSASTGKKLVLKGIKTQKPQRPAWSAAGIAENTRPF